MIPEGSYFFALSVITVMTAVFDKHYYDWSRKRTKAVVIATSCSLFVWALFFLVSYRLRQVEEDEFTKTIILVALFIPCVICNMLIQVAKKNKKKK
jgi:hypothetical protein